jgi:hypothetical protein
MLRSGLFEPANERRKIEVGLIRGAVVKARMWATSTGPFFARFFIGIIPGLVAEFAFMGQSTKLVMSSSPARWKGHVARGPIRTSLDRYECSSQFRPQQKWLSQCLERWRPDRELSGDEWRLNPPR